MNEKQLKVVLWIAFTALFFIVFCGVDYLIAGRIDWRMALFFFIISAVLDKKGISYMVDHYGAKLKEKMK